jgi:hypothetical protein
MTIPQLSWFKSSYSGGSGDACVEVALTWYKSSYSGSSGDDCVEVALTWHKSSYSGQDGDACVEVAPTPSTVHIRDSKDKNGAILAISPATWNAFLPYAAAAAMGSAG